MVPRPDTFLRKHTPRVFAYGRFFYSPTIMKHPITPKDQDYSQWYLDVIEHADLAENSPVRGSMVIKPNGYAIWENIKDHLDKEFKRTGHKNAYFPLLIPKSFFAKEAKHIEGFAQESAVVTHYRLQTNPDTKEVTVDPKAKLEEELIIRPTSETMIHTMFKKWIHSYRDLPLLINQWANVMRWEMRTRPFLRTSEFLWQEGHTAHASKEEAKHEVEQMLEIYRTFAEDVLAIPVIAGAKTESERFAGAINTLTIEAMMQDGKALQMGTSHELGQNFSKAFDIQYTSKDETKEYPWLTSWGVSTRLIGGLIMTHSDDKGLVLPPKIAPTQVVILPIIKNDDTKEAVMNKAQEIADTLNTNDIRVEMDARDHKSFGEKSFQWEQQGVPIRIEIGERDLEKEHVVVKRRDKDGKEFVGWNDILTTTQKLLDDIQQSLFGEAKERLENNTHTVTTWDELEDVLNNKKGFALAYWDGTRESEEKLDDLKATIRCIPFEQPTTEGKCIVSGATTSTQVIIAKAY